MMNSKNPGLHQKLGRSQIKLPNSFGLVPDELEDEDDELSISLMPGDYMAFYEPWDGGDYDT